MSGVSSNKNGKRTALVYLINDLFGMIICGSVFYALQAILTGGKQFAFMDMQMTSVSIALLNTVYRVVTILILAPFIKQINKLVFWLIKETDDEMEDQADFDLLEERFLRNPELALAQVHTVMNGMATGAQKNVMRALHLMEQYTTEAYNKIQDKEKIIDKYEDKLGTYLMRVTATEQNQQQTRQSAKFLHTVSDFERIADHACGISRVAKEISEKNIQFSADAQKESEVLIEAVKEIMELTIHAFENDDIETAHRVEPLRITIRLLCGEIKKNHIIRLQKGNCDINNGFAFNDLLSNLERIAAHCSNIAVAMIEFEADDFNTHEYLRDIRKSPDLQVMTDLNYYSGKYTIEKEKEEKA